MAKDYHLIYKLRMKLTFLNYQWSKNRSSKIFLSKFPDIFSKDDFDLGCLSSGIEHKIITHEEVPIKEKFPCTPLHFQQQEK